MQFHSCKHGNKGISRHDQMLSPMYSIFLTFYVWVTFAQENCGSTIVKQSHLETRGRPTGTLIVSNKPVTRGEEGYVVFFMIRSSSGSRLDEMSLAGGSRASLSFSVSAQTKYELLSYIRDCEGNCGSLDLPMDECRASFTLKPNQTLYVRRNPVPRRATLAARCDLVFSPQPQL